eukprot:CAMPEP_0119418510 /NCGR_PEP_ID=MMETSP1335-20130426/18419_1 /TAXON_ID=259385 /ORGANISM="Chrysoculter rhomboideus, Strain RCC1486" /LENGTH=38 /DNA_ID= /DNA_START= /DNA_END= /DNA_ORIENTATION=
MGDDPDLAAARVAESARCQKRGMSTESVPHAGQCRVSG